MNQKQAIINGVKAIMPLCIGDFPFSFIVGALSIGAGMTVWQSTSWSLIVLAGSSQMVALDLLNTGTSIGVIVLTTLIINLRHVLYSASLAEPMKHASFISRVLMAYGLTDEVYAITVKPMHENNTSKFYFYMAAMLTFWGVWGLADFLGAVLGAMLPDIDKYGLDFAMVAAFIAIVVPQVKSRACIVAAVVASVSGVLLVGLPYSLGIVAAALIGGTAGLFIDFAEEKQTKCAG
ncbi:AzlC family ABC transporter permease [Escherichia coli]|uniref:AzlC family ABC transporter permease n=1 Tax=Escherichia coli TaxID=562 RepID=UPI0028791A41|nr:AzlC family ABC transporter permease [Escherichia coli]MDS1618984.1 AzlC family ABC transporter permease [Escherichia coli]